ncbi:DUF2268 domain-containing protein [Peribacillus sp. NPDC046944]|uniref:DUF2268 domain-containing protein n=2 Tax=Peribacillus TaxID=2675229 RepID=UPI003CFD0EB7
MEHTIKEDEVVGAKRMGVISTNEWMEKDFDHPVKMMKKLKGEFYEQVKEDMIYRHLQNHGMYLPNPKTKKTFDELKQKNVWVKTQSLFTTYKKLWGGPDIPIYIFPLVASGRKQPNESKSGLAFKDKLFLFYDIEITEKEMEAVLIHEYHHVCRLHHLKKAEENYTLLDTMIMEGLAERTVGKYLGTKYLAKWTQLYSEEKLQQFWDSYLVENLNKKRTDPLHDALLLGKKGYPEMLGYCSGFHLVKQFKNFSVKKSFAIQSEEFITEKS